MEQKLQKELETIIKETVKNLVDKMGFSSEVEIKELPASSQDQNEAVMICNIKNDDSHFLIGQYGVNLQSIQHIARLLVRRKTQDKINFIVDVNSYRQEKIDTLGKLARETADQAVRERRAVVMRAMSAYERRIVHMELSQDSKVKTESIGEGEERKVVIKPAESLV